MAEPKNTGKGKETIGGIVIAVILFLLIAVAVVAGIALFRKYREKS